MKLRIVVALGLVTNLALADAEAPPSKGSQGVPYELEIDQSAVPQDRVLAISFAQKWTKALSEGNTPSLFVSPLKGQLTFYVFVVPRAELGKVTVKELQARGQKALRIDLPADGQLALGDPRVHVLRKARVKSVEPLEIENLEDVFESKSGEALCRVPPLEDLFDAVHDPCIKPTPTERMATFLGQNLFWLAPGLASALLIGGVWFAIRRRKRLAP